MIGRELAHYRILAPLGAGGMGQVFVARDLHLERDVAIKILPTDTQTDVDSRARFRREALALSELQHPHIAVVHDFSEEDGVAFMVMELVDGEPLDARIARGPLGESEIRRLGAQVAEALTVAHSRGIVHRDLKPSNVMLTSRSDAKVLDFGIAKRVTHEEGQTLSRGLTEPLNLVGTLPYMAPEQLRGGIVDARTDVFSLGAVLYEMATGRRPFEGSTPFALAEAILHQEPVPPRRLQPELGPGLESTILRALAKDPEQRFASAADLGKALGSEAPPPRALRVKAAWRPGVPGITVAATALAVLVGVFVLTRRERSGREPAGTSTQTGTSVAVLPFENASARADDQYFADGITSELINALGRVPGLRVPGRTSVFALRHSGLDARGIGRRLGATLLLEGSVQRSETKLRVTAELVDAETGDVKWSDSYSRNRKDILDVEDEITRSIVGALQARLALGARPPVARLKVSPEAHDLYLKGRWFLNQRGSGTAIQRSVACFERALAIDSTYAEAWAGLAQARGFEAAFSDAAPGDAFASSKAAAQRAAALDDGLAMTHTSLAFIAIFHDWDFATAKRELDRALALDPTDPLPHLYLGWYFRCSGQLERALEEMRTAQHLDPLNPIVNARVGTMLNALRRYSQAETELRQSLDLDTSNVEARGDLAMSLTLQGRYREAFENIRADTLDLHPLPRTAYLGYALGRAGHRAEALALIGRLTRHERERYVTPETFAYIEMGLQDTTAALDWLDRGYRERSFFLWLIGSDPVFEPLRTSARFQRLTRDMHLAVAFAR